MSDPTLYYDMTTPYLELHALRAPVGGYRNMTDDDFETATADAIADFEREHDVAIHQLGRSGRHICVADTPKNRKRYAVLRTAAIDAARALWKSLREETP